MMGTKPINDKLSEHFICTIFVNDMLRMNITVLRNIILALFTININTLPK